MEFSKKNIGKLREDLEKAFESGPVQELKQKLGI